MLKVFDLTLVLYDSNHPLLTFSLGIFALSPFIIIVGLVTLLLTSPHTRTFNHILLLTGVTLSHLGNSILKRVFREARPVNAWLEDLVQKQCFIYDNASSVEYGMPSAHAQFMFFFTGYLLVNYYYVHRYQQQQQKSDDQLVERNTIRLIKYTIAILWSVLVCVSRVAMQYHTVKQVALGAIIGLTASIIWRVLVVPRLTLYFNQNPFLLSLLNSRIISMDQYLTMPTSTTNKKSD